MSMVSAVVLSQTQLEPESWIDLLLGPLGLLVFLLITVWAFATRRVVSRGTYDEMREDRDRWRDAAIRGLAVTETVVPAAVQPTNR